MASLPGLGARPSGLAILRRTRGRFHPAKRTPMLAEHRLYPEQSGRLQETTAYGCPAMFGRDSAPERTQSIPWAPEASKKRARAARAAAQLTLPIVSLQCRHNHPLAL